MAVEEYRVLCVRRLASTEIQRTLRGSLGRKRAYKVRMWSNAEPGPARIKLGLEFIQDSRNAFERQREEIDTLHRAQEKAETRVSHIYNELKDSEKELVYLERQMEDIDHQEHDFGEDFHRSRIHLDGMMHRSVANTPTEVESSLGTPIPKEYNSSVEKKAQVERIKREKQRQHLESELSSVLSVVDEKKRALEHLELAIADIEETRQRKDREFGRLQRNLMELLDQQKEELDELRQKGIELETVTATTAITAASTAERARDHEEKTNTIFNQQEELMKFQFMSMSMSYFSSLNMLNNMRGVTSDITASDVSNSANAAVSAAAAAKVASLPSKKSAPIKLQDTINTAQPNGIIGKVKEKQERDAKNDSNIEPMPPDCSLWTIKDVSRWLRNLSLGVYIDVS